MKILTEQELHKDLIDKFNKPISSIVFNTEELETDDKTLKGAINEVFNKDDRIKQILIGICKTKGIEISRKASLNKVISEIINKLLGYVKEQKSIKKELEESQEQNRKIVITLDDLISVDEIKIDNGEVTHEIDDDDVIIKITNGKPISKSEMKTLTKEVTDSKTSSSNEFPENIQYDKEGFTGKLSKDGESIVISGNKVSSDSITETDVRTSSTDNFESTISYNHNGYSGVLYKDGESFISNVSSTSDSKIETDARLSLTDDFPSSIPYNSEGYSGILYKNGRPIETYAGGTSNADSKIETETKTSDSDNFPETIEYSKDGYTGTLKKNGSPKINQTGTSEDSKVVTKNEIRRSEYFPERYISYNEDGYTGTLYKDGEPTLVRGNGETKIVTETRTYDTFDEPYSVSYYKDGYAGDLTLTGEMKLTNATSGKKIRETKTQSYKRFEDTILYYKQLDFGYLHKVGDIKEDIKKVTKYAEVTRYGYSGDLKETTEYSDDDGYTGTLYKDGNLQPPSGPITKTVTVTVKRIALEKYGADFYNYDRDGFKGRLKFVKYANEDEINKYLNKWLENQDDSILFNNPIDIVYTGEVTKPAVTKYSQKYKGVVSKQESITYTQEYEGTVYTILPGNKFIKTFKGEVKKDYKSYCQRYKGTVTKPGTKGVKQYIQKYEGTVTKPGTSGSIKRYIQNYRGTVTKPGTGVREYTQRYKGIVTKPGYDTRQWKQNYKGTVTKQEKTTNNYYKYNLDIKYSYKK